MLVLAMEFSRDARARKRRSLETEQEQPDAPRSARNEGIPPGQARGRRPTPGYEERRITSDRLGD